MFHLALMTSVRAFPYARLARMSGSGATCFALFEEAGEAEAGAEALAAPQPGWWVVPTVLR